jgi:hydroxymethylpyrimidine/phosphomethylpyrimidine kinase
LKEELFPHTYIVTPNVPEAERLTGLSVRMKKGWKRPLGR